MSSRQKAFIALVAGVCIAACTSTISAPSPTPLVTTPASGTPSAGPTASRRATAQPLARGELFTMPAEPNMVSFFADHGSIVTLATRGGPSPYLSTLQRAEPASGVWRTVFEDDAMFMLEKVTGGRMALVEYRETPLSGGAYDETVVVVDLGTGQKTTVDHFALSAATYRGGGSAPRRAVGGLIALGPSSIAWTHLSELAGGTVEAELRVASLAEPGRSTVIGRSREWIEPIAIDDRKLVYVVGGTEGDDLRARDLATGRERTLAELRAPTVSAGRDGPMIAGVWVGWIEHPPMPGAPDAKPGSPSTTTFRAINLESGEVREQVLGAASCNSLSANADYFVWDCGTRAATRQAFDPSTWKERDVVAVGNAGGVALAAVDGGFIWYEAVADTRPVTLLTTAQ